MWSAKRTNEERLGMRRRESSCARLAVGLEDPGPRERERRRRRRRVWRRCGLAQPAFGGSCSMWSTKYRSTSTGCDDPDKSSLPLDGQVVDATLAEEGNRLLGWGDLTGPSPRFSRTCVKTC